MTVILTKTKAEQALLQGFDGVAGALPGAPWMAAQRRKALGVLEAAGLPHRRIEEWKYTDLRAALKEAFPPAVAAGGKRAEAPSSAALVAAIGPELAEIAAVRAIFRNGRFAGFAGSSTMPDGLSLASLADALAGPDDISLARALAQQGDTARAAVIAINTAYLSDGALIRVAAGATIALPIHLVFLNDAAEPLAVTTRNVIEIGAGAVVTIIESHVGRVETARQANAVTQLVIGEGATVQHVKVLGQGRRAVHLGSSLAEIDASATYRAFEFAAGVGLVRNETTVTYRGSHARADVSGITLGRERDHVDTTLTIDHAVPHCESRELFKYVLDGEARGVFQGKVIVRPDAQKSDGKQMAQALMLSETAEFDSKPELEIYADDVVCGHGSTVTEIDPELVFYCRSRGIPLEAARALLIDSFIGEAIEKVDNAELAAALAAISRRWLVA